MIMGSANQVKILDVCQVTPAFTSPDSATEFSLPLTFFDIMWLKVPQVERICFYEVPDLTPAFFNSVILPKLKHSLSLTLLHFLPLAGNLVWPSQATKPIILYTPNDGLQLIVAESSAGFDNLAGNGICEVSDSRPYLTKLPVTESKASAMAMQITYFPNQGFCIGISSHHAVLDGTTYTMFIKAWAHICKFSDEDKQQHPALSPEQTPLFDRTAIQDPQGLETVFMNNWLRLQYPGWDSNPRSLKLLPVLAPRSGYTRAVVQVSRQEINKLRERVRTQFENIPKDDRNETRSIHMSSFVLVYAYVVVCMAKSKRLEKDKKVILAFMANCRARLDPPIPDNYFGNCVNSSAAHTKAKALLEENGLAYAVERLSGLIRSLEKGVVDGVKETLEIYKTIGPDALLIGVAGSPRFDVYGADFGWGRPKKVEIMSIDKSKSISMTSCQDGSGGIEIGLVLEKHEMEIFVSLFADGLKNSEGNINYH